MFNTIRLSEADIGMPGRNAAEKQANKDEHGDLWLVIGASRYGWELESMASGQKATLTATVTPKRSTDPWSGSTLSFRR